MFGTLIDWVRSIGDKIFCRNCDYKTLFSIGMVWHLKKWHNIKPTKKDLKFLLKYSFLIRLIKFIIACVLIPPLFIIKCVFYYLGLLGDIL